MDEGVSEGVVKFHLKPYTFTPVSKRSRELFKSAFLISFGKLRFFTLVTRSRCVLFCVFKFIFVYIVRFIQLYL